MSEFALHLHDVFRRFGAFEIRRMFSGHGLFRDGIMFALVVRETLYLKADEGTVAHFLERSLPPFEYQRQGRTATLPYHRAPEEIFEDADVAAQRASRAWEAALRRRANTVAKRSRKAVAKKPATRQRSEEHTSELQSH